MIRMRASGVKEARLFLQNISSRTTKAIREEMIMAANDTRDLAEDMAPWDTKSLENSIDVVQSKDSNKQRFHISVVAGANGLINPISDKPVSAYAAIVHENYESFATGDESRRRRLQKQAKTDSGAIVGGKFLERALNEVDQTLAQRLGRVLMLIGGIERD